MTIPLRAISAWLKTPTAKTIGYEVVEKASLAILGKALHKGSKKSAAQGSRAADTVRAHRTSRAG